MGDDSGMVPAPLTSFVGRRWEQEQVVDLLGGARLVTLIGPGGCGKTRLAVEVAGRVAVDMPTCWVDLQRVPSGLPVTDAILSALGSRGPSELDPIARAVAALGEGPSLIVLDNCEHVLDSAAGFVAQLLAVAPHVVVLATSREPMRLAVEVAWRVPSLELPTVVHGATGAASLLETDAGRLFAERARAALPSFDLADADADPLVRILRRLDGIPLAIELAAVRVRAMGLEALAAALDDRFTVLTGGDRAADPRHQTLLASVEWSHDLLTERERVALRRLGVFAGAFTTRAAEAVIAGEGLEMADVLPNLVHLVERSLVSPVPSRDLDRYQLLDTIRAFAADRLAAAEESTAVSERHRRFFAARTAAAAEALDGRARAGWLASLEAEAPDIAAARRSAAAVGDVDLAASIAAGMARYWTSNGLFATGEAAFAEVLALPDLGPGAAALAWWGAAHVATASGDVFSAAARAHTAVALAEQVGDDRTRGRALTVLAASYSLVDPPAAAPLFAEAAVCARRTDDLWCLAEALQSEALTLIFQNDLGRALQLMDESHAIAVEIGDEVRLAWHGVCQGWLATRRGDMRGAIAPLREAIVRCDATGDPAPLGLAAGFLSEALAWTGSPHEAVELVGQIIAHHEAQGGSRMLGPLRQELGTVLLIGGRAADALAVFEATLADPVIANLPYLREQSLVGLGACRVALDRTDSGEPLEEIVGRDIALSPWARSLALILLAEVRRREGDSVAALELARQGLREAADGGFELLVVEGLDAIALIEAVVRPALAARLVGAARQGRTDRGVVPVAELAIGQSVEAEVRLEMGDLDWHRLEADGRTLTLEQAVELALAVSETRPTMGWAALTRAEARVAELAARGHTNARIADELFVSRETIKSHLSRVFAKLGVSTRTELAANWPQRSA